MTSSTERGDASESGGPQRCESNACIQVDVYVVDNITEPVIRLRSTQTGTVMQATYTEWNVFVARVKRGEFDDDLPVVEATETLPAETHETTAQ